MASRQQLSPVDGLAQLSFVVQGMLERRAAEHGLSIIQARLLGVLRDRKPTMNELARLLGLDKSSVTGLVDRAERRGLVARVPSITDRRAVLVRLTDDGRALVSQAAACFETDVMTMLGGLPVRDRDALSRLVSRVLAAHAAEQGIDLFPAAAKLSWVVHPRFSRQTPHDKWHASDSSEATISSGAAGGRDAERAGERRARSDGPRAAGDEERSALASARRGHGGVQRRAFPGTTEHPAHLAAPAMCAHVQKTTDFPGRTTGGRVLTLAASLSLPRSR